MIAHAFPLAATARPLPVRRRQDIGVESLVVRGQRWWRLKDPLRLQFWQFGEQEYFLWSQLQAGISLQELQRRFAQRFAPDHIELSHLHEFLGSLHREGLVCSTAPGQAEIMQERYVRQRTQRRWQAWTQILAIRFRGLDPTRLLDWLYPKVAWMFSPWSLAGAIVLIGSAMMLAILNIDVLRARMPHATEFLTADNFLWFVLTLAVVKISHELGHALTCRHLGGRCHELGVMLLIFTPCLYCNVSDAWLMPSRWRRMAISAAGMGVELTFAAVATWLWWFSEPGLLSTLCWNVMVIGSVNTILFNGNPLLRFDGYFLLSDFCDIPNLRQASDEWLRNGVSRFFFGVTGLEASSFSRDRPALLATYAISSLAYRISLTVIIWWVIYHWLASLQMAAVGAALIILSAGAMAGQTTWRAVTFYRSAWHHRQIRPGRALTSLLLCGAALTLIGMLPWPRRITAPVALRPADAATVYVPFPGQLISCAAPGTRVQTGDVVARLRDRELDRVLLRLNAEEHVLRHHLEILKRQQIQQTNRGVPGAAAQVKTVELQLADVVARLAEKRADLEQLTVRAPRNGIVIEARRRQPAPDSAELPRWQGTLLDPRNLGCPVERGDILCQIGEHRHRDGLLVVDQSEIDSVATGQSVRVQLDELPRKFLTGKVARVAELSAGGAPLELAAKRLLPVTADLEPQLVGTHYQVTVSLEAGPAIPFGASGQAKIRVAPQALALRLYKAFCDTFFW